MKSLTARAALAIIWTIPGFAQTTGGSDSKTSNGKPPATGNDSRKKLPGRMKSGQIASQTDAKSGNQKQPDIAVKGAGVPIDTTK
jgi:hypothetical protein